MIHLDLKDSRPLYIQIEEKLKELMVLGVLEEDSQLPSVRSLAMDLSINPNTIQRAYGELERDGFIYSVKGRGSFVGNVGQVRQQGTEELYQKLIDLSGDAARLGLDKDAFMELAGKGFDSFQRLSDDE